MIKEIKLSSLNNVIPNVNKKEPPRSINYDLTPFFFTSMFIGSKNSGKSYGLVKMIKIYEEQPVKDKDKEEIEDYKKYVRSYKTFEKHDNIDLIDPEY